jgi:hypothetical protein
VGAESERRVARMGKSMDGQKNFRLALCFRGSVPLCLCASVSVSLMTDEENSRLAWAREGTRAKWYCKQGEEGEPGTG